MRLDQIEALGDMLARLRYDLASVRMALLERKYRADQPRVPAGSPEGGEWTTEDGGSLQAVANRRVIPGPIDLRSGEGGHSIQRHVNQSDTALKAAVAARDSNTGFDERYSLTPQDSFDSWESANRFTNDVIASRPSQVNGVISGAYGDDPVFVTKRYSSPTGREAYTEPMFYGVIRSIRSTFSVGVVLVRASTPRGYRVITAYPMNSDSSGD